MRGAHRVLARGEHFFVPRAWLDADTPPEARERVLGFCRLIYRPGGSLYGAIPWPVHQGPCRCADTNGDARPGQCPRECNAYRRFEFVEVPSVS